MSADPWEHLLGMGLGAVFVNQLVKWDAQLQQDLDKMLEKAKAANERRYFGIVIIIIIIILSLLTSNSVDYLGIIESLNALMLCQYVISMMSKQFDLLMFWLTY